MVVRSAGELREESEAKGEDERTMVVNATAKEDEARGPVSLEIIKVRFQLIVSIA